MVIYNAKDKKIVENIEVSADDFTRLIEALYSYGEQSIADSSRSPLVEDTVPGRLALGLIQPLGYESLTEFFEVTYL